MIKAFNLLNVYLFLEEGLSFYKNYFKIGFSGLIGGFGLATAMITFIWSITSTTAAVTLLCLAAMPFITALLGFLFLRERISVTVWISIFVATFGIVVMVFVSGFYNCLMESYVKNSIKKQYGHIQIHHPEFREYKETKHNIAYIDEVKAFLTD